MSPVIPCGPREDHKQRSLAPLQDAHFITSLLHWVKRLSSLCPTDVGQGRDAWLHRTRIVKERASGEREANIRTARKVEHSSDVGSCVLNEVTGLEESGGAEEDRTPDPLRARQVLSQLSYGPGIRSRADKWWVWVDSNHRPHPYQRCALTN